MAGMAGQLGSMPSRYQPAEAAPYGILVEEDLFDDATGAVPTKGLGTPLSLKDRTLRRLSKMLGAEATVQNVPTENGMHIYLTRTQESVRSSVLLDEQLRKHVRELEGSLKSIAQNLGMSVMFIYINFSLKHSGPLYQDACEDLWEIILVSNSTKVDQLVQALQKLFEHNQGTFDHLVTKMFGIDDSDTKGSRIDRELGDEIIMLSHHVRGFDGSVRELNTLIQFASTMTKTLSNLRDRLKYILEKSAFADELFGHICQLGFPERVYATLVRSARASQKFRNVTFHLRPNSPAKNVSFMTPLASSTQADVIKPSSPPAKDQPKQVRRIQAAANAPKIAPLVILPPPPPPPSPPPPHRSLSDVSILDPLMIAVQPCLALEDQTFDLNRLSPPVKRETARLVGTALQKTLLPVRTIAWYSFGFAATADKSQECELLGIYHALLKKAKDPKAIFSQLQASLENNTLVAFLDNHGWGQFREECPYLEGFLTTPPTKRWTVWRLRQFIEDGPDDEPPACLQRDFGFRYCRQREEVVRLKEIYANALRKMGPAKLHEACVNGRLYENAVREGVVVAGKDKRFLHNDYPSPFVGFDGPGGLDAYGGRFYKKNMKL